jgi:hypothetical protein
MRCEVVKLYHSVCYVVKGSRGFLSGDEGIRTPDPLRAKQVLSQLSYAPWLVYLPVRFAVGLPGLEPGASVLSGLRSNHLS